MKKLINLTFERLKIYFESFGFNEAIHYEHNYVFCFSKTSNGIKYLISVGYNKNDNILQLGTSLHSRIISEGVNVILGKYTSIRTSEDTILIFPDFDKNFGDETLNQLKNLPIQTQEEFEAALSIISTHIETYILPFFTKVPNLQTINDEIINKVPQQDYTKYIKGSTTFKVLIIMKLCNNPKFNDFKNWALEAYEEEIPNDPEDWTKALEDLKSLIIYLESGQYQECLT